MQNRSRRWMDDRLPKLGRRWFLGGAGAAVALPFLEISREGKVIAQTAAEKRLLLFHVPAGCNMTSWAPSGSGRDFSFGETQQAVEAAGLKDRTTMVVGTDAPGGPMGHTCGISGVLTGVGCQRDTSNNAISMDQVAAQAFEGETRFSSIQLGTNINRENPNDEPGYSTVIKANLSWANATTPLPAEIEPAKAFNRLFEGIEATGSMPVGEPVSSELQAKDAIRASVLDYVLNETESLRLRLGQTDREKMDQYLTGLRQLETAIQTTPMGATGECTPGSSPSEGTPSDIQDHVKLMLDITALAVKCGLTRVATFGYEHTTTSILHPFLDVNESYHIGVTHHAGSQTALANYTTVNKWLVEQCVYLAQQLDAVQEGEGTLLDNSVILFFSELSDGDTHSASGMPVMLLGSAGGALNTGQLLSGAGGGGGGFFAPAGEPIERVHLGLLQAVGVNATTFGRATAPLDGLLA